MSPEEAIKVADDALYAYAKKNLTDIQRFILHESLLNKRYEEMQGYETQHIKNVGAELWKLLSDALGEKVRKTNFQAALIRRADLSITSPVLDIRLGKDELEEIQRLFSKRDSAVLKKDTKEFLTTQLNGQEIRGGTSAGYIECSKMATSILQIESKFSQTMSDICSPSPPNEAVCVVNVKEVYEHNNKYSHSGYISYSLIKGDDGFKIVSLKNTQESQLQDKAVIFGIEGKVAESAASGNLLDKRIEACQKLFYAVKQASGVISDLFEAEELSNEIKQKIAFDVGLEIAELTDSESFFLDCEVVVHTVGAFVRLGDIFDIDDPVCRQAEIDKFRKNLRNTYRMIESVRDFGELDRSIRSPIVDYVDYLKQIQDKQDQVRSTIL
jgi:hypothetical protein